MYDISCIINNFIFIAITLAVVIIQIIRMGHVNEFSSNKVENERAINSMLCGKRDSDAVLLKNINHIAQLYLRNINNCDRSCKVLCKLNTLSEECQEIENSW
jgi:hypothetical protein